MITPEMTPSEILKEVKRDMPHVLHALHKGYGGKRGYEADKQQMSDQVLHQPEGSIILGNVETYTSGRTGNHWVIYSYALNIGFRTATAGHRQFVWWNTPDGSIAAMQFADPSRHWAWTPLVYTEHFFKRYAERENLGEVDLQLVIDFMRQNAHGVVQADEKPVSPGKYRFDIILRNGIGRGYTKGMVPEDRSQMYLMFIRTYLPNDALTPSQRRTTADSRAVQASKLRPADTFVNMVMGGDKCLSIPDYFADFFLARNMPDSVGRMFARLITKIILSEFLATYPDPSKLEESTARAFLLSAYHRYQQGVFDYVVGNPSKTESYSILEAIAVAKISNPKLNIRDMMMVMMDAEPDNTEIVEFIDRTSADLEARYQEGVAAGKIKV